MKLQWMIITLLFAGEFFQCLALDAIANIGGKEMAESLAPVVQKLLVANTSPPHVKKRAALALLRWLAIFIAFNIIFNHSFYFICN